VEKEGLRRACENAKHDTIQETDSMAAHHDHSTTAQAWRFDVRLVGVAVALSQSADVGMPTRCACITRKNVKATPSGRERGDP
jgi:hypothetical protein